MGPHTYDCIIYLFKKDVLGKDMQELHDLEQKESQIHINPIFSVIHDEIIEEEERIYMIENDNSSENSYIDDY